MQAGEQWLHRTLSDSASGDVLYERPGLGSVTVRAARGARVESSEDATGVRLRFDQPDWIIRKELLVIDNTTITPRVGDQIIVSGRTYEVCHVGDGEPPAVDSGRYGVAWRIHTQLIEVQT